MPYLSRSVLTALLLLGASQRALAQVANPSPPTKSWNLDVGGSVGVRAGIGALTTSVDLSGSVTVVRTTETEPMSHRCLGLTAMFVGASDERALFVGPRWDSGDDDGTVFLRILAGPRRLSGSLADSGSETTLGVGAGVGLAVGGLGFDVNWIMSPWAERGSQRVSVSLSFIWSVPLAKGRD